MFKPGNIFLIKNGIEVKIGDFGLACELVSNQNISIKNDSSIDQNSIVSVEHTRGVGTSFYSSPEQLNEKYYDFKVSFC